MDGVVIGRAAGHSKRGLPHRHSISSSTSALLNGVRGFSSVAVVVGHGVSYGTLTLSLMPPRVPWMQEIAVVAFFWMSGFLVASAIDRVAQKGHGGREFIVARAVRIFVPLWPALMLTMIIDFATHEPNYVANTGVSTLLGNALALNGVPFAGIPPFGSNRPLWTVAIEWWLYVLAAVVAFRPRHPLAWAMGGLAMSVVLSNLFGGRGSGLCIVWGIGAAGWLAYRDPRVSDRLLVPGIVLLALAGWRWLEAVKAYDWPAQVLFGVGASMLAIGLRGKSAPPRLEKAAHTLALPSYSLYLVHYPIMLAIGQPFDWVDLIVSLTVSVLVASAFVVAFEMPRQPIQARVLAVIRSP
jgi:peptidoglycan/LPS O-acetylase OafA/YrhL